jgi:NRPS condensation-like uncharacterized protein
MPAIKNYSGVIKAEILDSALWAFEDVFGPFLIQVLVEFDPLPDVADLMTGIKRAFAMIPLLSCRIEKGRWRDRWAPIDGLEIEDLVEVVDLPDDGSDFEDRAEAAFEERAADVIDISKEPPFYLLIFRRGRKGLAIFRFHHSIADGNGCLQMMQLIGENMGVGDKPEPDPIPMNRSFFQVLGSFGIKAAPGIGRDVLKESVRPFGLLLGKALADIAPESAGELRPSVKRLVVEGEKFKALHEQARENGITINDALCVALLAVAAELNEKLERPGKWLNAGFTVNLRRYLKDPGVQITNISGIAGITTKAGNVTGFKQAAAEAHNKIGELKRRYLGIGYVTVPQLMTLIMPSPIMHWFVKHYGGFVFRQTLGHTMGMTNIGAMDKYLAPFGEAARNASVIATMLEIPLPMITATGFKDRLTLFMGWQCRREDDRKMCDHLAERLRFYLEEWPYIEQ